MVILLCIFKELQTKCGKVGIEFFENAAAAQPLYKLSENQFKNLLIEINKFQQKLSEKNESNDSKLKDSISRCSKISYLNEYSLTNELSENTLPIIKVKLMIQKIIIKY